MAIVEGKKAPAFTLPDQDGKNISLSDFTGKNVVLYFYPKDDTPGCTKEACGFRDSYDQFKTRGAVILGVSPDPAKAHQKLPDKFSLPFPLLIDDQKKIINAYGVWRRKCFMGRKYM